MNEFEKNRGEARRRNYAESAELGAEAKERQLEEAEKKMAARERIETVSREVRNTKQQIQNITANIQQVVKAVAAIRAQFSLLQNDDNIPSVQRDQKTIAVLRKKLDRLFGEMKDLQAALLAEEEKGVAEEHPDWDGEAAQAEARDRTEKILKELGME